MTEDLLYGWALGLTCGLAIGLIILAAYHHHVVMEIRRHAEPTWKIGAEALELLLDDPVPYDTSDAVLHMSPEEWRKQQDVREEHARD